MILPPFLVIFTIYGALTDISAATEGTTEITEMTLSEPILYEQSPGIQLPETVMETNVASTPATTTESPPAEVTAIDEQMTETPAIPAVQTLPETADPQPTTTETTTPATTPIEEATTPEATAPNPPTTETTTPDMTVPETPIPEENPVDVTVEQPASGTETPIETEQPAETPTVPTEPIEVTEEPAQLHQLKNREIRFMKKPESPTKNPCK